MSMSLKRSVVNLSGQDSTSREQVLFWLKKLGTVTVQDLIDRMDVTGVAIRRYITELQEEGHIVTKVQRHQVGRPTHYYQLTDSASELYPRQYDELATELFDELEALYGESGVALFFEQRSTKLKRRYEDTVTGETLEDRLEALVRVQNEQGYMANVHPNADGSFSFEEKNCPIGKVACRYGHACRCELQLFRSLLQAEVERTACMAEGGNVCSYRISPDS
ncbi:helix-turn-helix transcriptional regulator [Paenibacillus popilliae]|nr:HTH domain-containing protein [Paenibacillus sp. SDF0028]